MSSAPSPWSRPTVRVAVFLWGIVFPIVFVALPLLKVATGEAAFSMQPVWAFAVWILSPLVVAIVMKNRAKAGELERMKQE